MGNRVFEEIVLFAIYVVTLQKTCLRKILFPFFQAVNAPPDTKKKALLQDTPTANVYSQLQKLAGQNPACKLFVH